MPLGGTLTLISLLWDKWLSGGEDFLASSPDQAEITRAVRLNQDAERLNLQSITLLHWMGGKGQSQIHGPSNLSWMSVVGSERIFGGRGGPSLHGVAKDLQWFPVHVGEHPALQHPQQKKNEWVSG